MDKRRQNNPPAIKPNGPRGAGKSDAQVIADREAFVATLIDTGTVKAAAERLGWTPDKAYTLSRDPIVRAMFIEARREVFRGSMGKVLSLIDKALDTLKAIMENPDAPPGSRVQASSIILAHARDAIEIDDLTERVARLEAAVGKTPQPPPATE